MRQQNDPILRFGTNIGKLGLLLARYTCRYTNSFLIKAIKLSIECYQKYSQEGSEYNIWSLFHILSNENPPNNPDERDPDSNLDDWILISDVSKEESKNEKGNTENMEVNEQEIYFEQEEFYSYSSSTDSNNLSENIFPQKDVYHQYQHPNPQKTFFEQQAISPQQPMPPQQPNLQSDQFNNPKSNEIKVEDPFRINPIQLDFTRLDSPNQLSGVPTTTPVIPETDSGLPPINLGNRSVNPNNLNISPPSLANSSKTLSEIGMSEEAAAWLLENISLLDQSLSRLEQMIAMDERKHTLDKPNSDF